MEYSDFGPADKHYYVPPQPLPPSTSMSISLPSPQKGFNGRYIVAGVVGVGIILIAISEWQKREKKKATQK